MGPVVTHPNARQRPTSAISSSPIEGFAKWMKSGL
jgi:hypothetical protein